MPDIQIDQKFYVEQAFTDLDLTKQELTTKEFDNCTFTNCNFSETIFNKCKFSECDFINCNLSLATVKDCAFIDTKFESSKLVGLNWCHAAWPKIKLTCPIQFFKSNISHSTFYGLSLREMIVVECLAHNVDFREADLTQADFNQTELDKSLFVKTDLTKANFVNAINYSINPTTSKIKGAKFSLPEAVNLLYGLEIELIEP